MWHVVAEEDMDCTDCGHRISSGTGCLSQMPPEMPEGFRRRKYENFCIACEECAPRGRKASLPSHACYVRWLDHGYLRQPTLELTAKSSNCDYCGDVIPGDTWVVAQKLYVWPDSDADSESRSAPSHSGRAVTGLATGAAAKSRAAGWHDLSRATQDRFQSGGLGRGLGSRSPTMAQRLYEKEVPEAIRNLGEPAVRDFLKGKHFSHIKSVANAPGSATAPSNVVLENSGANLSRGSRNMTRAGRAAARSTSQGSAVSTGAKAFIKGGAKAGIIAAAAEAVVSVPENILHHRHGRKSGEQAVKDTGQEHSRGRWGWYCGRRSCNSHGRDWTVARPTRYPAHDSWRTAVRRECHPSCCQGCQTRPSARRVPSLLLQNQAMQDHVCQGRHYGGPCASVTTEGVARV